MFLDASVHPYGSFWLDVVDKVIKGLAVVVAGGWTYVNFRLSRTYRPTVECTVSGDVISDETAVYVLVKCVLKNAGQSKYVITQRGTYLEPVSLSPTGRQTLDGSEVFKEHEWIEPGEEITEPVLLYFPDLKDFAALKLNLRVVSGGIEWNASSILLNPSLTKLTKEATNEPAI